MTFNSRIDPPEAFKTTKKKPVEAGPQNIHLPSGPYESCQDSERVSQSETAAKRGPRNIEIPRRVLTTGAGPIAAHHQDEALSKNKLLHKRVNDIQLPERVPTEAIKTGPSKKETAAKAGPRQDPTTRAGLY